MARGVHLRRQHRALVNQPTLTTLTLTLILTQTRTLTLTLTLAPNPNPNQGRRPARTERWRHPCSGCSGRAGATSAAELRRERR